MKRFTGRGPTLVRLGLVAGALMLLAAPSAGAVTCPNDAFRTGASAALPDCRAFELVSPANKTNGVTLDTGRFRLSEQEGPGLPTATVFQSLGGFADPIGSGIAFDYMAQRTLRPGTQGWSTHAITPLQDPLPLVMVTNGYDPLFVGEASPDLTRLVHRTVTQITPAPNMPKLAKLFRRDDLRTAGGGDYQLINDAVAPIAPPVVPSSIQLTHVSGASTDLTRVLFESVFPFTADAPPTGPKVYKSIDGVVHLVGVLPDDEGGGPAPRSIAGQSGAAFTSVGGFTPNVLSDDGSRAFFTVPETDASGAVYMRDDQGTADPGDDVTVRLNASERRTPDDAAPATYWNAAEDGSRVFFMSAEALTEDAPDIDVQKLYVYDTTKPPGDPANLTYISSDLESADPDLGDVIGVMDVSADGRTAYFIQRGQIVAGQPVLDDNLGMYAWREGVGTRYVGQMLDDQADPRSTLPVLGHTIANQWGAKVPPDGDSLLVSLRQPPWPGGFDHGNCGGEGRLIDGKIGCQELYLYDFDSGAQPICISCPDGTVPTSAAFFSTRVGAGGAYPGSHRNRPITDDGSLVFFSSEETLVAEDVNRTTDAYQYDVAARRLTLLSSGKTSERSFFVEASADGQDVFIGSREQLSPWDGDRDMDIYDARVGGGVAPPPVVQSCIGDACQGPLANPPGGQTAGTSTLSETPPRGRVTRPRATRRARRRACRRNRVRRRVDGRIRCVTRARARRLAHARRAHQRGRGGAR